MKNEHLIQLIYELNKNNDPPAFERYKELARLAKLEDNSLIDEFTLVEIITRFHNHISEDNKKLIISICKPKRIDRSCK